MNRFYRRSEYSENALLEVLSRLWQVKVRSVELMEAWAASAKDFEIKSGLKAQVNDERRHARLLAEELKRRGYRHSNTLDFVVTKAFALVQAQPSDIFKVCAFHRGIKGLTRERCYRLVPMVDSGLSELLQQILHDEDRHLRWADLRLARSLSGEGIRQCNAVLQKMGEAAEAIWSKPWRRLTMSRLSYLSS